LNEFVEGVDDLSICKTKFSSGLKMLASGADNVVEGVEEAVDQDDEVVTMLSMGLTKLSTTTAKLSSFSTTLSSVLKKFWSRWTKLSRVDELFDQENEVVERIEEVGERG
jgi:uncharacterized phage infection (PIP) family protein YhgE